jgi:xanthine dehydrogenase accessory factor
VLDDFFALAHDLQKEGRPFATAHVVRAERPTSARPGDRAIVTADGTLHGWIGGSCAQPTVVEAALAALADGRPRLVRLSPDPAANPAPPGYEELPMTCFSGGTLDVYVEPQRPQPRLLVVGDLPVAQALAHLGRALAYRVLAVTSDDGAEAMAHADEVRTELAAIGEWATAWTWVVVATHGRFDEPAVAAALRTEAPYVALVASPTRAAAVAEHLEAEGLSAQRHRLRSPAGLDIGARRGDEIALSILAEIVQLRRAAEGREAVAAGEAAGAVPAAALPAAGSERSAGDDQGAGAGAGAPAAPAGDEERPAGGGGEAAATVPETALDPVCGMTVRVTGTTPSADHAGRTYWFCCGGCAARFAADPESFLAAQAG